MICTDSFSPLQPFESCCSLDHLRWRRSFWPALFPHWSCGNIRTWWLYPALHWIQSFPIIMWWSGCMDHDHIISKPHYIVPRDCRNYHYGDILPWQKSRRCNVLHEINDCSKHMMWQCQLLLNLAEMCMSAAKVSVRGWISADLIWVGNRLLWWLGGSWWLLYIAIHSIASRVITREDCIAQHNVIRLLCIFAVPMDTGETIVDPDVGGICHVILVWNKSLWTSSITA